MACQCERPRMLRIEAGVAVCIVCNHDQRWSKSSFTTLILSKPSRAQIRTQFFFLFLLAPGMDIVIIWQFLQCWATFLAKGNNCLESTPKKNVGKFASAGDFAVSNLLRSMDSYMTGLIWSESWAVCKFVCFHSKPSGLFSYSWIVRLWQTLGFSILHDVV